MSKVTDHHAGGAIRSHHTEAHRSLHPLRAGGGDLQHGQSEQHKYGSHAASGRSSVPTAMDQPLYTKSYFAGAHHNGDYSTATGLHNAVGDKNLGDHTKDFSAQGAYGYRVFQPAVGAKEEDDCEMRPSGPQSASSGNGDLPQVTDHRTGGESYSRSYHTEGHRRLHEQPLRAGGGDLQSERHNIGFHPSGRSSVPTAMNQKLYTTSYFAGPQHGGDYSVARSPHSAVGDQNLGDHTNNLSAQGAHGYRVFQPAVATVEEDDCEMRPSGPINASSGNDDLPQDLKNKSGGTMATGSENESDLPEQQNNTKPSKIHTAKIALSVNEDEMMGEHESYHQEITGEEAKRRLQQHGDHCYLTRYSEEHQCYILSVYEDQLPPVNPVIKHFKIVVKGGKLEIMNKKRSFDNVDSLMNYYKRHRIDPALASIGDAYTLNEYKRIQREELQRQERERQEQEKQERERQERERQEQERQEREGKSEKGKSKKGKRKARASRA